MDKYSGKKLDGRYEIQELIGAGGMANVYRAFDTIDERTVAIKILKDEFLNNDEFIRRFKNESKAIALLSHPNIVQVYDVSFGDVIQYIVVEYIDGITLKEYIEMQGAINWREAVHFVTQILKALEHAHENGIIHRDIKPQNIMLLEDGTIKVTDFGIARFSNTETRTMTEKAIGSVHYIAPEQARGEVTDGKADIYAVGVMLYELLTGKLPFEADNAVSVAIMQLQSEAKRPQEINPSIPDGLEEITIKAMQKNPAKRYQSAGDMLNDIEKFKNNPSIRFEYKYFASDTNRKSNDPLGMTDTSTIQNPHKPKNRNYQDEYGYEEEQKAPQKLPSGRIAVGIISAAVIVIVLFG
ncbi:MAG: protein kinase, partial [Bacillota bacterium]|nr:protein kinase [Bacillota bacterium]